LHQETPTSNQQQLFDSCLLHMSGGDKASTPEKERLGSSSAFLNVDFPSQLQRNKK
jgi:hypothetical protein